MGLSAAHQRSDAGSASEARIFILTKLGSRDTLADKEKTR